MVVGRGRRRRRRRRVRENSSWNDRVSEETARDEGKLELRREA